MGGEQVAAPEAIDGLRETAALALQLGLDSVGMGLEVAERLRHGRACPSGPLAATPMANCKTFFSAKPEELLLVHGDALSLEQDIRSAIAEATPPGCQIAQP